MRNLTLIVHWYIIAHEDLLRMYSFCGEFMFFPATPSKAFSQRL
jgi:hypothetical protein